MEIFNVFLYADDYGSYINAICVKYIMHNHIVRHHISGRIQLQVELSQGRITRGSGKVFFFLGKITSRNREKNLLLHKIRGKS